MAISPESMGGKLAAEVIAERIRCIRDACMYCNGNAPQYETEPKGPNSASNWTHTAPSYSPPHVEICRASTILNRAKFHGEIALTLWALSR